MYREEIPRCFFCKRNRGPDYKETEILKKFLFSSGNIKSGYITDTCPKHQIELRKAVENARKIALLPYPHKKKG